ncbi:MAG: tetratricopeptide repeat protein [Bryobacterales bacterium]|nr:tetratricopeptide repeat protein [Bryobacterales bacterium]
MASKRFHEAAAAYRAALHEAEARHENATQVSRILSALGVAEYRLGNMRKAKSCFLKAVRVLEDEGAPVEIAHLMNAGKIHLELGEGAQAERCFRRALEVNPGSASLRHNLGQVFLMMEQYDKAEAQFRAALALPEPDPSTKTAVLSDLASLLSRKGDRAGATTAIEDALKSAPSGQARARVLSNRASIQWRSGKRDQAELDLRAAWREAEAAVGPSHPDLAEILREYAHFLKNSGRHKDAKQIAERASQIESAFAPQTNSGRTTVDILDLK